MTTVRLTVGHVEYGYSCMGYEIAGGLGAKLAAPDREVFVMVGDGSYLMIREGQGTAAALPVRDPRTTARSA